MEQTGDLSRMMSLSPEDDFMTEPTTPLQFMQWRMNQVGGECWVEELLIRGQPGGGLKGAHVSLGWRAPGLPGHTEGGVNGPYPLAAVTDDLAFAEILSLLNADVIQQAMDLQQQLNTIFAERDVLQQQVSELQQKLAALQAPE